MAFDSPMQTRAVLCLLNPAGLARGPNASGASQKEFLSGSPGGFGSLVSVQTIIIKPRSNTPVFAELCGGGRGSRRRGWEWGRI